MVISNCEWVIYFDSGEIKGDFVDYYVVIVLLMLFFVVGWLISFVCCL